MQPIKTCLGFDDKAEDAVNFYVSVFKNSKILEATRAGEGGPAPKGTFIAASFELDGQEFMAINGGPDFTHTVGMSLVVTCDTQKEIDEYWEKLTAGGGAPGPCGWLTDRFGVSWQIVPASLGKMLGDARSGNSAKAMQAMLKMSKLDIRALEEAYKS
jgi:predicted 3-demethylubiquinone-9 3-methyltransferase (glyoxalase superfamily)